MSTMNLQHADFWIRIGVAVLCGFLIGMERMLRRKPFGIRTAILICLGTMIFVELGQAIAVEGVGDPARVIGQIVPGIGFLGAGAILNRDGKVHGLTSAATIWLLAGIGSAIGLGFEMVAIALTVVIIVVLRGVEFVEQVVGKWHARRLRAAAPVETEEEE